MNVMGCYILCLVALPGSHQKSQRIPLNVSYEYTTNQSWK